MKLNENFYIGLQVVFIISLTIFGVSSQHETKEETQLRNRSVKYLKENIKRLMNSPDSRYEEKSLLREHQKTIKNIENLFRVESENKELVSKMENELKKITEDVDQIKESCRTRQKSRLTQECVNEIQNKNLKVAVRKLYFLDDKTLFYPITLKILGKNEKNFGLVLDFVNEIPSIMLSFNMYESIFKVLTEKKQFTPEKGLDLIKNIKKNVVFQYSVDEKLKLEALDVIEALKNPVKDWVSSKLTKSIEIEHRDEDASEVCDVISYEIKDLKFLRDIIEDVLPDYTSITSNYVTKFLIATEDMKPVPKAVMSIQLYESVIKLGVHNGTIPSLLNLRKTIEKSYRNESVENKKMINDLFTVPDLRGKLVEIFKDALINGYYHIKGTETLNERIFLIDVNFFKEVVEETVKQVYGKQNLIEMIKMFRGCTKIGQSAIGYKAVYDMMKTKGELILISKNIGPLLKLESVVTETLGMTGLKYVAVNLVTELKIIQYPLVDLKNQVLHIMASSLKAGNYSNEEHKNIGRQIFAAETFQFFANKLADLYGTVNSERLMDYCMALPLIEERIVALRSVMNKVSKNNDEYFKIASYLKVIKNDKEYNKIAPDFKLAWEYLVMRLPSPARFSNFAKEVYLKSMKVSEYLDLSPTINGTRDLYTLKNGKKGRASKWILESTDEPTIFKIKNSFYDEYLYASAEKNNIRNVSSGNDFTTGHKWKFILTDGGVYIRNVAFKEYFIPEYKAKHMHKRFVYTNLQIGVWKIQEVFHDP